MTVQAGAARTLLDSEPDRARESLLAVEDAGRASTRRDAPTARGPADGRRVDELGPQPSLCNLADLVRHVSDAGLPVDLDVEGEPRPLAARPRPRRLPHRPGGSYERRASTPARRARSSACATRPSALELAVENEGRRARRAHGGGHGLVGMRERVALYGGELEAGPRPEGGFASGAAPDRAGAARDPRPRRRRPNARSRRVSR